MYCPDCELVYEDRCLCERLRGPVDDIPDEPCCHWEASVLGEDGEWTDIVGVSHVDLSVVKADAEAKVRRHGYLAMRDFFIVEIT